METSIGANSTGRKRLHKDGNNQHQAQLKSTLAFRPIADYRKTRRNQRSGRAWGSKTESQPILDKAASGQREGTDGAVAEHGTMDRTVTAENAVTKPTEETEHIHTQSLTTSTDSTLANVDTHAAAVSVENHMDVDRITETDVGAADSDPVPPYSEKPGMITVDSGPPMKKQKTLVVADDSPRSLDDILNGVHINPSTFGQITAMRALEDEDLAQTVTGSDSRTSESTTDGVGAVGDIEHTTIDNHQESASLETERAETRLECKTEVGQEGEVVSSNVEGLSTLESENVKPQRLLEEQNETNSVEMETVASGVDKDKKVEEHKKARPYVSTAQYNLTQAQVTTLKKEKAQLRDDMEALKAELDQIKRANRENINTGDRLTIDALRDTVDRKDKALSDEQKRTTDLSYHLNEAEKTGHKLAEANKTLRKTVEQRDAEVAKLQTKLKQTSSDREKELNRNLKHFQESADALHKALGTVKDKNADDTAKVQEEHEAEIKKQKKAHDDDTEGRRTRYKTKVNQLEAEKKNYRDWNGVLQQTIGDLNKKITELKTERSDKNGYIERQERRLEDKDDYIRSLQRRMNDNERRHR